MGRCSVVDAHLPDIGLFFNPITCGARVGRLVAVTAWGCEGPAFNLTNSMHFSRHKSHVIGHIT